MLAKTSVSVPALSLAATGAGHREKTDRLYDQDNKSISANLPSGNRCGHDPKSLRYFVRPGHQKPRPHIIQVAMEKAKDIGHKPKVLSKALLTMHNSGRQTRSEKREAVAVVFQVLLHYLDLETLKVGFSIGGGRFLGLDLKYIAKKAGLGLVRTKRAIADMVKSGYLEVSRQFTRKDDGTFRGAASVRKITLKFFIDLGIDTGKLFFAREWKRKKKEKEGYKVARKMAHSIISAATAFIGKAKPSTWAFKKSTQQTIMANKGFIRQAIDLYKANPEKPPSYYLRELQRST